MNVRFFLLKGFGDHVNNFSQYGLSDGKKIGIGTTLEQAAELVEQLARDSTEGGGMVAIEPVNLTINVDKLDTFTLDNSWRKGAELNCITTLKSSKALLFY